MAIRIKICGLTSAEAADAAARLGAEYGGLNFCPPSPRYLALEQARVVSQAMASKLKRVAVVADADDAHLAAIMAAVEPDFLQLHGNETVQRTAEIAARFGKPIIKVLPVATVEDLETASDYEAVSSLFLFDARPPKGAAQTGGHGVAFDWTLLAGRRFGRPWFLAGGLNPDNVARAIRASGAAMVDVSSGVESAPGVKDGARIGHFILAARSAETANDTVQA